MDEPRLPEVDMGVNNPREDMIALGIDLLLTFREGVVRANGDEFFILYCDSAL